MRQGGSDVNKADLLLFDGKDFSAVTCRNLDDYYSALNCEAFDIATRKIGEKYFDIFCDDIGLFREDPVVTAVDTAGKPMLVGNLIFANHDGQGNTVSLSQEDVDMIVSQMRTALDFHSGKLFNVVICDY